jgi:hypothetical protein
VSTWTSSPRRRACRFALNVKSPAFVLPCPKAYSQIPVAILHSKPLTWHMMGPMMLALQRSMQTPMPATLKHCSAGSHSA